MSHDAAPTTMQVVLACGCEATLKTNITDGLDWVSAKPVAGCTRHAPLPKLPVPVLGFGPLWTWDANRADHRELPAATVARYEREHLYKLLEGYMYVNEAGKGNAGFGPLAKIHWLEAAHH